MAPRRKTLSYADKKALCTEYFEHESELAKLKEPVNFNSGILRMSIAFNFNQVETPSGVTLKRITSKDLMVEVLDKRMVEIKSMVGEEFLELRREMTNLKAEASNIREQMNERLTKLEVNPAPKLPWYKRMALFSYKTEGLRLSEPDWTIETLNGARIEEAKQIANKTIRDAAERGTRFHKKIEVMMKNYPVDGNLNCTIQYPSTTYF